MTHLIRTTITIPADIYKQTRIIAASEGKSLSSYISHTLKAKAHGLKESKTKIDPLSTIGKYSLGVKNVYNQRKDIYEDHFARKMGS